MNMISLILFTKKKKKIGLFHIFELVILICGDVKTYEEAKHVSFKAINI